MDLTETDLRHLETCVALAREALEDGDAPFGSVLADADGNVLFSDRNRVKYGDHTRHPEFEIARWSAQNMTPKQRAAATVYTSGEHCPMCSAAHAWVGLGRIVYATSGEQTAAWAAQAGAPESPVASLPISEIAPSVVTLGPVPDLIDTIGQMQLEYWRRQNRN